jgi:sphinganine-1-phosphate aldolase
MEARGWKLDRQHAPAALHCMVTPAHAPIVRPFLEDLRACVEALRGAPATEDGAAAFYGMAGRMPAAEAQSTLKDFLDGVYQP